MVLAIKAKACRKKCYLSGHINDRTLKSLTVNLRLMNTIVRKKMYARFVWLRTCTRPLLIVSNPTVV